MNSSGATLNWAIGMFMLQLSLNAIWTWLFFKWRLGTWSMIDIVALWLTLVILVPVFWSIKPSAGLMLIPYVIWVGFASMLNFSINKLNPDKLTSLRQSH